MLPGPAIVAPLGGRVATVNRPSLSVPVLTGRIRRLPVRASVNHDGRMLVDVHPSGGAGGPVGSSRGSPSDAPVLDPCWSRELGRVVAHPIAVRVEHHWVLSQPDDRHEQQWRNRVGRAGGVVVSPDFGLCDLVVPAFPRDVGYPAAARG